MSSSNGRPAGEETSHGGNRSRALLGDARLAHPPGDHPPVLVVVVDTEEEFDWFAPFDRGARSVSAVAELARAQEIFDAHGIRPVYAVDHAVASQPGGAGPVREILDSGAAVLAAHQHPWLCPPFEEPVDRYHSYPGNLAPELERRKLEQLVDCLHGAFGQRPRIHKAGRHGLGPSSAGIVAGAGFKVDMSARPAYDFGAEDGPDYSAFPPGPYWWGPDLRLLGVPETAAFVGFVGQRAASLYGLARRRGLRWARLPAILSRLGAVDRLLLSPEGFESTDLRKLTRHLLNAGVRTFTFSFHSPSLKPGCTPYVGDRAELERFLGRCRDYFEFFLGELGGVALTPLELLELLARDDAPRTVEDPRPLPA